MAGASSFFLAAAKMVKPTSVMQSEQKTNAPFERSMATDLGRILSI
jgi:hypothetical protein